MLFLDQLQAELVLASRGLADAKRVTLPMRRSRGWVVVMVALSMLALAAAAFAASRIIATGSPVRAPVGQQRPTATTGIGVAVPGARSAAASSRLLSTSVPDPTGGLPWGLRVVNTTRGLRCLQFGRLLAAQLGVLGRDGAFDGDRLLHPLPTSVLDQDTCVQTGDYMMASIPAEPASAEVPDLPRPGCIPPGARKPPALRSVGSCPAADERQLAFGLLGPHAVSLAYRSAGISHTIALSGP